MSAPADACGSLALLRVAALSVEESAAMVREEHADDPRVRRAIAAAAGEGLLERDSGADSVGRYVARMGGRATPFGLFAGTAVAEIGTRRDVRISGRGHQVRTRVDAVVLHDLVSSALDDLPVDRWPLRANPVVRREGAVVRFARAGDATADVVVIRATAPIEAILAALGPGVLWGRVLAQELTAKWPQLHERDVLGLLDGLCELGLLERADGVIEAGRDPSDCAVEILEGSGCAELAAAVRQLDADSGGLRPEETADPAAERRAWDRAAETVPALAEVREGHRVAHQLELATEAAVLDERTVRGLVGAACRLQRITATDAEAGELGRFAAAFRERYEDAEVPLLEAADLERGVLPPASRQLSRLAAEASIRSIPGASPLSVHPDVLRAYRAGLEDGVADITDLPADPQLRSRAVLATLLDGFEGRYDATLVGGLGRSPFALMARFALGRPELEAKMREELRAGRAALGEDAPLQLELVAATADRIANVLVRPRLHEGAIAIGQARGGTFALERLAIRLQGDNLALRDLETGRPVDIELTTAHNVDLDGLDPVYALLGRLAGGGGTGWSWGALDQLPRLPRVVCGRVIVSPARWRLDEAGVRSVLASAAPASTLRDRLGLRDDPRRWLGAGEQDHILPIDLDCDRSARLALSKHLAGASIAEMPQLEAPAAQGATGPRVAEAVIATGPAVRPPLLLPGPDLAYRPDRASGWRYALLHCGQASADRVVTAAAELARSLGEEGLIDQWHYLRYSEGGPHVRVRLRARGDSGPEVAARLASFAEGLRAGGLVSRVATADYVPEIGRYGGSRCLELAHGVFTASSATASAAVLAAGDERARLAHGVAATIAWIERIEPDPAERAALLRRCQGGLGVEFAKEGNRHGKLIRDVRPAIESALAELEPPFALLEAVDALRQGVDEDAPHARTRVLGSCLHMHCNRLYAFDAVRMELLTYELALRLLRSRQAAEASR